MSDGCVYLVGAGPGDPALLTVRGRQLLQRADVVVYDHLAAQRLLGCARSGAERIYVGKQANDHTLSQDRINQLLVRLGREGKQVVRLKGGDPFVFGRGGEEALALAAASVAFEVIPGVTAGIAAAACAGIPVTHRGLAGKVALIAGHEAPDKDESDLDYPALAKWRGTLVFYMCVRNLPAICRGLLDNGLDGRTPAAVIVRGATPRQRVVTAALAEIAAASLREKVAPPAIIVIGKVAALREKLNWFERRPLLGRRVVVTRARRQASQLTEQLEGLGAEVIELPAIRIEPPEEPAALDRAVDRLAEFDWIVFTSVNGVDAVFAAVARAGLDSRAFASNRICSIGPATAERLADHGLRSDCQPAQYRSDAIADALSERADLNGLRILCPRSDVAPGSLIGDLAGRGAAVTQVIAYRTIPENIDPRQTNELFAGDPVQWITFTSSSTVKNFFAIVPTDRLDPQRTRLASIGPVTSQTLRQFGLAASVEAKSHTLAALVEAILDACSGEAKQPQ